MSQCPATADEFRDWLSEVLVRLHDPDYDPPARFVQALGCQREDGAIGVQTAILAAIGGLKPSDGIPSATHDRRVFDFLHHRFVLGLTREETAERLHVSVSSVQRGQREAIHALARILWTRDREAGEGPEGREESEPTGVQAADWRDQAQRELAVLQTVAPDAVSDVASAISDALELTRSLIAQAGVSVEVAFVQRDLVAGVHPTALQQVLITALERFAGHIEGVLSVYARLEDGNVRITFTGSARPGNEGVSRALVDEILTPDDVSVDVGVEGEQVFLWIEAPYVGQATVLVVDDNPDMARFYRRCAQGTRYRIVHVPEGEGLLELVCRSSPDAILLDVMLPDIDGWRLLMHLRENLETRSIPVVICSVVREEALAMSLGAAAYLAKPISPSELIQTLDRLVPPAGAEAPRHSEDSAGGRASAIRRRSWQ
ncbi:MAG: response regulator [Chloroflexi bacterium]|nr:response regulator [Chloroflexota bacterium]